METQDIELPHESVDLLIMNLPDKRPIESEAHCKEVPAPFFAEFPKRDDEQRALSNRLATIKKALDNPVGHRNPGLTSNFIDLAHAKVKPDGVLALVLSIEAVQDSAWSSARKLLADRYRNIVVIATASGSLDLGFSTDKGMAEALIVATKRDEGDSGAAEPMDVVRESPPPS